ncbi:MAG: TrmH family RNA methyltransferase [Parcubacteria group bacterium]
MIVVLDALRSAHNVGSIFRTADALGINKIYLCGSTPTPLDRFGRPVARLTKVALGAEKTVPWKHCKSIGPLLSRLKKEGFSLLALEQSPGAQYLNSVHLSKRRLNYTALLLGRETIGLSKRLLRFVDEVIEIPQIGTKESLNVAVAFGIAAFWLTHQKESRHTKRVAG